MAEPVSLGASVLTFITLAGQLSKQAIGVYDSIKEAPEDVVRIGTRLRDLERILILIGRIRSEVPLGEDDPETQRYWSDKCIVLRTHFAEFKDLAAKWEAGIGGASGRTRWFLSHKSRVAKLLSFLAEDIEVVKSLHQFMMESCVSPSRVLHADTDLSRYVSSRQLPYLENALQQMQAPLLTNLSHVTQALQQINTLMATKQEFVKCNQALVRRMGPRMEIKGSQSAYTQRGKADVLCSSVTMQWACYNLPMGSIVVNFGSECDDNGSQYRVAGRWEFQPAPWLSYKTIVTQVIVFMRCGTELVQPTLTATLSTTTVLSEDHPIWGIIRKGDFPEFRELLCKSAVGANDTDQFGMSVLHWVYFCIL